MPNAMHSYFRLSVGIGAIRDAAELAFGVMLPSAETLNEERASREQSTQPPTGHDPLR